MALFHTMRPHPIPHGHTARRLTWPHLPRRVRAAVEERTGSPVAASASCDSGFTPGLASVLTCEDGSKHFVKAASRTALRPFAEAYAEEARKLHALPDSVPAARLLWALDGEWVVLGLEYVAGRPPHRPWRPAELERCLDAAETLAEVLTPAPPAVAPVSFAEDLASLPGMWDHVRRSRGDGPEHAEAAALAASYAEVTGGDTVVHTDLRADNALITDDGAVFCDWNFCVRGAAWIDTVLLLLEPRGDGIDADALLASRPLTADVPAEHVDVLLALITGYLWRSAELPVPPNSPYLRDHQLWTGDAAWDWLCERRGWSRRQD